MFFGLQGSMTDTSFGANGDSCNAYRFRIQFTIPVSSNYNQVLWRRGQWKLGNKMNLAPVK